MHTHIYIHIRMRAHIHIHIHAYQVLTAQAETDMLRLKDAENVYAIKNISQKITYYKEHTFTILTNKPLFF